ncbi:MAG: hypothetical protein HOH66_11315 [Rhodospirillaceae bacterium]|nr:hypothetical protein [Rhodospirillaceae bacterium]
MTVDSTEGEGPERDMDERVEEDPNNVRDPRPVRRHAPIILVATLALAVETILAVLFWRGALGFGQFLAMHIGVALLLCIGTIAYGRAAGGALPSLILLSLGTLLLGPLGPVGCLFTMAFYLATERTAPQFADWYDSLFPDDDATEGGDMATLLMERAGQVGGSVSPFLDVLSFGTRAQKQMAVAVMTRHFHPAFAPALRQALADADNAVRVQAATAMATIEDRFVERAEELRIEMEKHPRDPDLILQLARHYDDYAFTGLLDPQRQAESQVHAMDSYMLYLERMPRDADARLAVGRLMLRRGEARDAARWIERCLEEGVWSPGMAGWHMDALYRLGRYEAIRDFARLHHDELTRLDTYPIRLIEMVRLWAGEGQAGDAPNDEAAHAV